VTNLPLPTSAQRADIERLYLAAFPPEERDPLDDLWALADSGRGKFSVLDLHGRAVAFAFQIIRPDIYEIVSYLVVDATLRGLGIGSVLCRAIMKDFSIRQPDGILLIEGHDRQAKLYGELGFKKLALDYQVPSSIDPDGDPLHFNLLAYRPKQPDGDDALSANSAVTVMRALMSDGYHLTNDHPLMTRIIRQLDDGTALLQWPRPQ